MRVKIDGETRELRAVWREGATVKMIDQRLLPHRFSILTLSNHRETCVAIRDMATRGAGSIGVAAAYACAQAALEASRLSLKAYRMYLSDAFERIRETRPTAVNLFHAVDRCLKTGSKGNPMERAEAVCHEADRIASDDVEASRRIGEHGSALLRDGSRILTHCNAGALAYIDEGTALAPIRIANRRGVRLFVYADETRPRSQGAKLTAWELQQEGIPHALIADNAAGYYMRRGDVDAVIVGADRVAANGDTANKIGTYEKAVLAHENGVPFYVAAPRVTFDLSCRNGDGIEIEMRSPDEVTFVWGETDSGEYTRVRVSAQGTNALNPSFDVTPAKYITGFITEKGILRPPYRKSIHGVFGKGSTT